MGRAGRVGWPVDLVPEVPEPKVAKNRQHFDLRAMGDIPAEIERLTGLGATLVSDRNGQVVMADPEGNEFCVE